MDFEAGRGITAIIGANGSGKSTLLKSITGHCNIFGGSIYLDSKNITGMKPYKMLGLGISYMPQVNNVFAGLTVLENMKVNDTGEEAFELFPVLRQYLTKKAMQLSGGERQMLAMAMTLSTNPKVILFDEPTAALSPKNAKLVHEKIMEIRVTRNICIIMVEQNAKEALALSDNAYLFAGGQIEYSGDPQKLLLNLDTYLGIK